MSAPVRHTCPDIDKAIKQIIAARMDLKHALEASNDEDKNYYIGGADDELYGLGDMLEDLRSDNSSLRDWGHHLERRIEELENEVYQLSETK